MVILAERVNDLVKEHAVAIQAKVKKMICKFEAALSDNIEIINSFVAKQAANLNEMHESVTVRIQALELVNGLKVAV